MSPFRMARDARDLYRGFVELLVFEDDNEDASYEIAASARDFSRNAQAAVDDKLNFSATLMRAGEVEAANRLLKEFHDEVRDEEVALIERVNEVKAAEAVRKAGMTRVRLARVLAVAMVGSSLLSFSAAGMALAGLVRDRAEEFANVQVASGRGAKGGSQRKAAPTQAQNKKKLRRVNIGDVKLLLSASELRTIRELAGGSVDESRLEDLIEYLPTYLADKVEKAIVVAAETTEEVVETVQVADLADLKAERRRARKAAAAKAEAQAEAEAEEQPTPQPSESEDDERQGLGPDDDDDSADDGDEKDGGQEEEDGDNVPLVDDDDEGLL
jgi:hypothetical protein